MTETEAYARCALWMQREIQQRLDHGDTLKVGASGDALARRWLCREDATIGDILDRLESYGKETQYPLCGWGGFIEVHPWWDMLVKGFGCYPSYPWEGYLEAISGANKQEWLDRAERMWKVR